MCLASEQPTVREFFNPTSPFINMSLWHSFAGQVVIVLRNVTISFDTLCMGSSYGDLKSMGYTKKLYWKIEFNVDVSKRNRKSCDSWISWIYFWVTLLLFQASLSLRISHSTTEKSNLTFRCLETLIDDRALVSFSRGTAMIHKELTNEERPILSFSIPPSGSWWYSQTRVCWGCNFLLER